MYDINSRNDVRLVGNVGSQFDVSTMPNGQSVVNMTLCTNQGYKTDGGEAVEQAVWHDVTAYGPAAERLVKSGVKSGSRVLIEGRLSYNKREKNVDGVMHVYHNAVIVVEESMNLTPREANEASGDKQAA